MNKQQLLERIHEAGLSRIAADVEALLKSSVRLAAHASDDAQIPVGASKLGGLPDLPADVAWPQCQDLSWGEGWWTKEQIQGGPLFFLLQLNMADVAHLDSEHALPDTGMLYFFAALWKDGFPNDGVEPDSWKVIYYDGERNLLRRTPAPPVSDEMDIDTPLPLGEQIKPCTLVFEECYVLPRNALYSMGVTAEENDTVGPMLFDLTIGDEKESSHLLLGNAQEVQNAMQGQCETFHLDNEPTWEERQNMSSAELRQYYIRMEEQGERKWRLLLQVDTAPDIRLEWQEWGRGYFWIRSEDLAARNFDIVCLVMQHT